MQYEVIRPVVIVACAVGLSACAAKPVNMTVGQVATVEAHRLAPLHQTITLVEVSGGKETKLSSQVSDEAFMEALRQSLANNNLLAAGMGDYELAAELVRIKKPALLVSSGVRSKVRYRLSDRQTGELLMDEMVRTKYVEPFGTAWTSEMRIRKSIEGSLRQNVVLFMQRLAEQMGDAPPPRQGDGIEISIFPPAETGTFGY
ncbi:hypothetical protein [Sphingomicrobium astaxanthinifaciens]|uniref:hypothetical protein n=1 Tax=Sphingomicrobium astaxanthinifaciens TaxID=1227949 RepID=UPI001FCC8BE8|nr:hypothetical protein [Sphingomicrobium astaxanthinifaciens]MCJ7422085.1 hypothetical protein [Sphingomicrobium astaxanthinifaciens]